MTSFIGPAMRGGTREHTNKAVYQHGHYYRHQYRYRYYDYGIVRLSSCVVLSEKGKLLLRGVGTLRYLCSPNAPVRWQPDSLTIHAKKWFPGAGFLGAPPISLILACGSFGRRAPRAPSGFRAPPLFSRSAPPISLILLRSHSGFSRPAARPPGRQAWYNIVYY